MGEEGKEPGGEKKEGSGSSSSSDFPPKKQLVRQLDFTSSAVAADGSSVPAEARPTQPVAPTQENHQQARPLAPPTTSSAVAQQGQTPLRKPDSPKSRSRPNADVKEGTPKKQKQCNCRHSRCLKLYCECFASGIYCDGCNCVNCCNNVDNEAARRDAVETTLERNPNAFRPKIASSPHGTRVSREEAGDVPVVVKHNKGCHCKKSGCLKKYCECFQANILCSDNCKCMDCKNFEGSEERQALFHGDQANNITYIQQAANAAITGAIGSSGFAPHPVSKKRKGQENLFGSTVKDPSYRLAQFQQASHLRASVPSSSFSSHAAPRVGSTTTSSPSKCHYRSLLADIIQPQDVKELCSVLVVLSAKVLEDMKKEIEKQANQTQTSASHEDRPPSQMETKNSQIVSQNCSTASQVQNSGPDHFKSDGTDAPAERPMSPGTLELMCDEQDMIFPGASPPNELFGHDHNRAEQVPYGPGMTEIYEEQERTILTKFRDTLNRLITCGQIKESRCSLSARSELGNKSDILSNGTTTARSGSANQQLLIGNGSEKVVSPASKPLQTPSSVVANVATDCSPAGKPSQMPSSVVANAATDWSLAGKPAQAPGSVVANADTHCRPAGKPSQTPGSVLANAAMDCGPAGKPAQVPGSVVANAATHCRPAGKPSQVPGSVVANAAMDFSPAGKPSHTPSSVVANVGTDNGPAVRPDTQNGETSSKS